MSFYIICPRKFYDLANKLFKIPLVYTTQNNDLSNINKLLVFEKKIDNLLIDKLSNLSAKIYGINVYLEDNILLNSEKIEKIFSKLYFKYYDDYKKSLSFFENENIFYNNIISTYLPLYNSQTFNKRKEKRFGMCIGKEINLTNQILTKLRANSIVVKKNLNLFHTFSKDTENLKNLSNGFNKNMILDSIIDLNTLKQFNIIITSDYLVFVSCIIQDVPVIPINFSKKMEMMIKDIQYYNSCSTLEDFDLLFDKLKKNEKLPIEVVQSINDNIILTSGNLQLKINTIINNIYENIQRDIQNEHNDKNKIINFHIYNDIFSFDEDYSNFDLKQCNDLIYNHFLNNNTSGYFQLKNFNFNSNVHRSGWKYICDNLKKYHQVDPNLILFDTYIDRTFFWDYYTNKYLNQVPYTRPWIGVIHHPYNELTPNNSVSLFKNTDFINSLQFCKGLICLSDNLKKQIEKKINSLNLNIPVYSLLHPTEIIVPQFSIEKFLANPNKNLLHVGSWLRNLDYFYFTDLSKILDKYTVFTLQKIILTGSKCKDICNDELKKHDIKNIKNLEFISNQDYDKLLSENLVFVNLVDASAVNLVLECIVRKTPIIINRLPALEQVLGSNYPLFYDNINDIPETIDISLIKSAFNFMKNIDIDLSIETFCKKILEII